MSNEVKIVKLGTTSVVKYSGHEITLVPGTYRISTGGGFEIIEIDEPKYKQSPLWKVLND